MAVGDVYMLKDFQTQESQQVLNVYFYHQSLFFLPGTGGAAGALAQGWVDQKLPSILAVQAPAVNHERVEVFNLFNPQDFYTVDVDETGERQAGDTLPQFVSFSTRFSIQDRRIKAGGKRISGVQENMQVAGVLNDAGVIADLADMDEALRTSVLIGLVVQDPVFNPVVVKRIKEENEETGKVTYRLPEFPGEALYSQIAGVLTSLVLGSMNTRKRGRGQ